MDVITDAERAKIQKEAQELLKRFSATLAKVNITKKERTVETKGFREEGEGAGSNVDFRTRMFANAPVHDEDCILAEKKQW